ncbi:hypothetical protein N1851_028923 [Merluccius polli]|uniref:Uncharacterized protein n=1 Tax=Merluccius polli TaxID=89951 RepID=A0AA47M7S5_MERPO|nr:hypothetical protein N1851_028923 [Merluccius polli]
MANDPGPHMTTNQRADEEMRKLTLAIEIQGESVVTMMELLREIRKECGVVMGCRRKGEKKYEVTMKEAEGRGKLLDGLRIKDCRVVVQNIVTDEMIVSFLNLPVYMSDSEVTAKLTEWGVKAISPIKWRMWPGTEVADGTRFMRVKFTEAVRSLPYSTSRDTFLKSARTLNALNVSGLATMPETVGGEREEQEAERGNAEEEEERRESRGKAEQEAPGRGAEREKEPPREEEKARPGERQEEQESVQEAAGAPEDGDRSGDDLSDVRPDTEEEEMDEVGRDLPAGWGMRVTTCGRPPTGMLFGGTAGGGERDKEGVEVGQRGAQRSSWTDDDLDDDEEVEEMDGEVLEELCRRSLDRTTKAQMKRKAEQKRLKDGLAKAKKQL